jgi:hypothetical protein
MGWPDVGEKIGMEVSNGRADQGFVFCWTGTAVTIATDKVPGVRAALCWDAETAKGAHVGRCQRFSYEPQKRINCCREGDLGRMVF